MESTASLPRPEPGPLPIPADADPVALIEAARKLVGDSGSETLLREWRRLYARSIEPTFSVAVVGELSRGKSTLVNRLLGAEVVPVGPLPTTALPTRVLYAPEPALFGIRPDGTRQQIAVAPESWQEILAGSGEPAWIALQCDVPNDWLQKTRLQLFDTPGAGDLSAERLEEVIDTISLCDATLVVLSATMALSLTERSFLEQQVLGRHVPRVLAVLTHLDEVRMDERSAVIQHVRQRLTALCPEIAFATAHGEPVLPSGHGVEIAGPEPIAATLAAWAADSQHQDRVRRQLTANLRQFLSLVSSDLEARQASLGLAEKERRQRIEAEHQRMDHLRLDWEDIRLAMRARSATALSWMDEQLLNAATAVTERLDHELRQASDPGLWWQQNLPFRLRQELAAVARALGEPMERRFIADATWLRSEVERRFSRRIEGRAADPFLGFVEGAHGMTGAQTGRSLRSLRMLTLLGTGTAAVIGFMIYGPLGTAASFGGGLLMEYLLHRNATARMNELSRVLAPLVGRVFTEGQATAHERLQQVYESVVDSTLKEEEAWSAATREALEQEKPASGEERERMDSRLALFQGLESLLNGEKES